MFVHRKQRLFLSENVDDIKMSGKKQNLVPMWKHLMRNDDLEETTSFLDHVYLGCTQGECKPTETVLEQKNEDVRITYLCWSNRKVTWVAKTSRTNCSVVLRNGRTCSKNALNDTVNWQTRK